MSRPNQSHVAKIFGKRLTEALEWTGMSQQELAERTGLTPAAISQIVSGKREPLLSTVIRILEVIPIKFEKFIK
jgi:transcriptional regulator with XRE-family HTH domain